MTVKEVCAMLFTPKEIRVIMDGRQYTLKHPNFSTPDEFMMRYMADFLVEDVSATGEDEFYITVKMKPMTKGDIA